MSRAEIEQRFGSYKKPTEKTATKFKLIQEKSMELAVLIDEHCPDSREKATALTQLQLAKMSANASIAIHEGE